MVGLTVNLSRGSLDARASGGLILGLILCSCCWRAGGWARCVLLGLLLGLLFAGLLVSDKVAVLAVSVEESALACHGTQHLAILGLLDLLNGDQVLLLLGNILKATFKAAVYRNKSRSVDGVGRTVHH